MNQDSTISNTKIYYRLIALWALCEGLLGGILHGLRLPVTGLFVGGAAVICIALIAYYHPQKGSIIKATIIVAVFKLMLSPYASFAAFMAVFFQGIVGELLFLSDRKFFRIICLLLAVITMIESALQRILVLTIVFGSNSWNALNVFIKELTQQKTITNYSLLLALTYVLLHVFAGVLVGWFAGKIPFNMQHWPLNEYIIKEKNSVALLSNDHSKKKKKFGLLFIWFMLILLLIQSDFHIGRPLLPPKSIAQLLLHSFVIIFAWYLIINPLLLQWFKKRLDKQKNKFETEIQEIAQLLPVINFILKKSWQLSASLKGLKRMTLFSKIVIANTLHES